MATRAWGEGTVFFDKSKELWTWRWRYDDNGVKKIKTLTAKRKIDLKNKVAEFKKNISQGIYSDQNILAGQWIDVWLNVFVQPSVRIKSYEAYCNRMRHLKEVIGNMKLCDVTPIILQNAFLDLSLNGGVDGNGLAATSVNEIRKYFKRCCEIAIKNKIISDNPVDATTRLKAEEKEKFVVDESGVKKILDAARAGDYIYYGLRKPNNYRVNAGTEYYIKCFYNLISIGLGTGARIGEIRGLTWECVNFRNMSITIKQQIVQTDQNAALLEPYLKTDKSRRSIKIDAKICDELQEFKKFQQNYAAKLGDKFVNDWNLVFTNTFGKPINLVNFRRRYFYKMLAAAGISRKFTLHSMRHTHATLLLKNGVNVKVVSERLGHSSVMVTLKVYAHVLESMEETASATWLDIVGK